MTHPSGIDLEAFACGDQGSLATHVDACAACAAFVKKLRGQLAHGPSASEADAAVTRAAARIAAAPDAGDAPAPRRGSAAGKRRLWLVTTSVITPLAAAAAVLLLMRSSPVGGRDPSGRGSETTASTEGDRPLIAPSPQAPGAALDPDTTFKGMLQIAVIRERAGRQERFSSVVQVRPGDRLRVEVALDREQAILGAVLADDGSYLELMPEGIRGRGTHFSERSAKVDGSPTQGTIVIGPPAAVGRARATKQWQGVATLRVEMEP